MVRLLLDCIFPILLFVCAYIAVIVVDLRRPLARALGCILNKLCVVSYEEIRGYYMVLESAGDVPPHLWREIVQKKAFVIGGYVRQMMRNTRSFQQAARFDDKKIDPRKSSLQLDMRETLVKSLVQESAAVRWQLYKCQVYLVFRAGFRLNVDPEVLMSLLAKYKQLEGDVVAWAEMAEEKSYYTMLLERLGLMSWGVIDGNGSEPEPA